MMDRRPVALLLALVALAGCNKASSKSQSAEGVSDKDLAALSAETQYAVANRLLGALYTGVRPADFFDMSAGFLAPKVGAGAEFIARTRAALATPVTDRQPILDHLALTYNMDGGTEPVLTPLALMWELTRPEAAVGDGVSGHLSKDTFDLWMAYTLGTTILFSPATELDSVALEDAQKVLYRLTSSIRDDKPIAQIVYEHVTSQENWRRFRSPEDNTREMMEIFLARFIDAEVPKAAQACRNWHLSDESQGYQLVIGYNENADAQQILDTTVVSCYDFYHAVSEQGQLLPTIARVLVNRFLPNASTVEKNELVNGLVASNPETFRQLFTSLLFSKQHLLRTTRTKSHEETFFNTAHRIQWYAGRNFFQSLNRPPNYYSDIETLHQMKQAAFSYKLGRREIPLDSLSFSSYHKSVRERLLINRKVNAEDTYDGGWRPELYSTVTLRGDDYLHYLFLSVLSRRATDQELTTLKQVIAARGYADDSKKKEQAMIVLDYFSRLSELYTINAVDKEVAP
jgi:hypothetical protein